MWLLSLSLFFSFSLYRNLIEATLFAVIENKARRAFRECIIESYIPHWRVFLYYRYLYRISLFRMINLFHLSRSVVYPLRLTCTIYLFQSCLIYRYWLNLGKIISSAIAAIFSLSISIRREENRLSVKAFERRISFITAFLCNSRYSFVTSVDGANENCIYEFAIIII